MDQPQLIATKKFVRDLADGQAVDSVFEVRALAGARRGTASRSSSSSWAT